MPKELVQQLTEEIVKQGKKRKKNERVAAIKPKWALLPLQFILVFLPLILYLKINSSGFSAYPWNSENDIYADVFLYGKTVVFTALAAVILLMLVCKLFTMDKQLRNKSILCFLPLLVYLFCAFLSTLCSEAMTYSLNGAMDSMEPVTVLTGYVVVALYAYFAIESIEDVKRLVDAAVIGGFCMATIGILQATGYDPLLWNSVQKLYVGKEFLSQGTALRLAFQEGMAYGTLFNPNYVGTYVAMYGPLMLIGLLLYKKTWQKLVCGGAFIGLAITLFASQSRTGLVSVLGVAIVLAFFLGRSLWKRWYLVIPAAMCLVMVFSLVDVSRDYLLSNRLKTMFAVEKSTEPVQGVDTTGDGVRVLYKDTEYTVSMLVDDTEFSYTAKEGKQTLPVTYEEDKSYAYFSLSTGDIIKIQTAQYESNYCFGLNINGRDFYFTNQEVVGNYKYINEVGRLDECIIAANVFPGYEEVASGRGYSWGRTIPLLWNHVVLGSGPDTFAVVFPQNDYVGRYRGGFDNIIFTRPHNFYLQMGVQTGVLSLLAFLVFYAIYFVKSCALYCFRKFRKPEERVGLALFLCTIGFMVAGLANDSLIVVTPIYYLLLGAGMAVNDKLCPKREKEKNETKEGN